MKATIIFFALIFGYIAPSYSQLNRQFQNKKYHNFKDDQFRGDLNEGARDSYNFEKFKFDKPTGFLDARAYDSFNMLPTAPAPGRLTEKISSGGSWMPCLHPKSGDKMPCFKPTDTFPMRVFKPEHVIWGTLF